MRSTRHHTRLSAPRPTAILGAGLAALLLLGGCDDGDETAADSGAPPSSAECSNGQDDDGDGLVDAADPGCEAGDVEAADAPDAGAGGDGGAGGVGGEGGAGGIGGEGGEGGAGGATAPTCDDGVQNGSETDVDCGGDCPACPPAPECASDDDCDNGTCTPEGTCACDAGFEAQDGTCVDLDECEAAPCLANEICTNTVGGFDCSCAPGATPADAGCVFPVSCAAIKRDAPGAEDGRYMIDPDGDGPAAPVGVHCDMTTDGGVGYTMLRYQNDARLVAGVGTQAAFIAACADLGMELVVPRSPAHFRSLTEYNGGFLNIIGVYPDYDGAAGLEHFSGRCQGEPCDFWISDSNNASCAGNTEPNGNNTVDTALIRQAFAECGLGTWDDQDDAVEIGGSVVCSTNDAHPTPRTCLDGLQRDLRVNSSGPFARGNNGVRTLDSDGPDGPLPPHQTFCENELEGGGWTLAVLTIEDSVLEYDHPAWTDPPQLDPAVLDTADVDALTASYRETPVRQAVLIMAGRHVIVDVDGPEPAPSMRALMTGDYRATRAGRDGWTALVGLAGGGLQPHCNMEGFNTGLPGRRVRLGIVGNNEMDCSSNDSFIGIGHQNVPACGEAPVFSGNNTGAMCGGAGMSQGLMSNLFVREAVPALPD